MNANNIPAGFLLVPREPTLDMYNAAVLAYQNWRAAEVPDSIFTHTDVWNAMIAAAAPTPPVQESAPQAVVGEVSAFAMREVLSELLAIDTAVDHWMEDKKTRSQLLRAITDNIRSLLKTLTSSPAPSAAPQEADALRKALLNLVDVIEAAGVSNLSRGVQLGPVVWSVKCNDALALGRAALAQQQAPQQGEQK